MSAFHAQAGHRLYLARLMAEAWQREIEREQVPRSILAQAFEPAICSHLADAYGWFLLEIARPDEPPAEPPRSVTQLPQTAAGRAAPPELREFERLEREGWLVGLLASRRGAIEAQRPAGSLAGAPAADPALLRDWADRLEALFARMSESLDEY